MTHPTTLGGCSFLMATIACSGVLLQIAAYARNSTTRTATAGLSRRVDGWTSGWRGGQGPSCIARFSAICRLTRLIAILTQIWVE